jgi:hypothetical protein
MNLLHTLVAIAAPGAAAEPPVPGYAYGQAALARAPYDLTDLAALRRTLLFGEDDVAALRRSQALLVDRTEAILDVWYGFVAATPELVVFFGDARSGQPDAAYLAAVRRRFALWIRDTAAATFDQRWLDWQYEIGLRHNRLKKNRTDGVNSSAQVDFRYLVALTIPITTTLKPFLAAVGDTAEDVERMHAAWLKAVLLQVILWSHPYVRDGEF